MKSVLVFLCFLSATAAVAQSGSVLSGEARPYEFASHIEHASEQPMSQERNLLPPSSAVQGHGERPLWEFAPATRAMPLGDAARILKQAHLGAKKADTVWTN